MFKYPKEVVFDRNGSVSDYESDVGLLSFLSFTDCKSSNENFPVKREIKVSRP